MSNTQRTTGGRLLCGLAVWCCLATLCDIATAKELTDDSEVTASGERLASRSDQSAVASFADDELWFISSRVPLHESEGSIRLHYWKYDGEADWKAATLEEFTAADPEIPICFHVHGDRVSISQANIGGWQYYQALVTDRVRRTPLRFVIFSWPSDGKIGRNIDDVRIKAARAESHALYLAWVVDQLPANARVSMIGFSFGARLIGGALHLLGGGRLRGQQLSERAPHEPRAIRAVFLAAALDNDHLLPGRGFGAASTQIDYLLIARNQRDHVLKWYPLLYQFMLRPHRGKQAMGYNGFAGMGLVPRLNGRIEHHDVSGLVGDTHQWPSIEYYAGDFLKRMRQCVYFKPLANRGSD